MAISGLCHDGLDHITLVVDRAPKVVLDAIDLHEDLAQTINALRGHLAEFGIVAPAGHARMDRLAQAIQEDVSALPETARKLASMLLKQFDELTERIATLEKEIRQRAPKDPEVARLMRMPGVGAICATAVKAFCPSLNLFRSGRDFAAWVGLTPKQNSTGGKTRLGRISKMG